MIDRLRNAYNALLGRKVTCGGNCSCHTLGDKGADVEETVGNSINLTGVPLEIAEMLRDMASPERHEELLAEMKKQDGENIEKPQVCVHFDTLPVCHFGENDAKPEWCSASKCPVRAYQMAFDEMKKKAAMIAYG